MPATCQYRSLACGAWQWGLSCLPCRFLLAWLPCVFAPGCDNTRSCQGNAPERETNRDLPTYPFAHLGQLVHRFLFSGACGTERRARVDASAQLLQPAHSLSHGLSRRPRSPPKMPSRVAVAFTKNACDTYECAHACCMAADLRPRLRMAVPHLRLSLSRIHLLKSRDRWLPR